MKCKKCNSALPIMAKYCPFCGNSVAKQKREHRYSVIDFVLDFVELVIEIVTDIDIFP